MYGLFLSQPEYNIFSNVSKEDFKRIRSVSLDIASPNISVFLVQGIIELILATDMSKHSEIMTSFKEIQPILDYDNNNHKKIVRNTSCINNSPSLSLSSDKTDANQVL